jgi:hypothetical protein
VDALSQHDLSSFTVQLLISVPWTVVVDQWCWKWGIVGSQEKDHLKGKNG